VAALGLLLRVLSHLPFWLLYIISDLLYIFIYYLIRYRRKIVYLNLGNSFPEKSEKEISYIARQFYKNLSDFIVETLKLITINEKSLQDIIHIDDSARDLIENCYNNSRQMIILSGHCFNWEVVSVLPKITDYKVLITYKMLSNQYFDKLFKTMREKYGGIAVNFRHVYRVIKEYENNSELTLTWISTDQRPQPESNKISVKFLNQNTFFYNGVDGIAKKTNSVVFFTELTKSSRKKYQLKLHLITDKPRECDSTYIIERYAKYMEELLQQKPDNWLWTHQRWKKTAEFESANQIKASYSNTGK